MAEEEDKKSRNPFKWAEKMAEEAEKRLDRKTAEMPVKIFLPGFEIGTMPNHVNRSSLFAPIARGKRRFHRQERLESRSDCIVEYTGEQLDEADADLVMALIHAAQQQPIGEWVVLHRAEILRRIGRQPDGRTYTWLHQRIRAMTEATLYVEIRSSKGTRKIGSAEAFHIISGFRYDEETEQYLYRLDPRWAQLYGTREYARIDWEKRMQIGRGQDMAKALQRLIATSNDSPQRYALDWLKDKMEYASPMRKFREELTAACKELERLEIIARWNIETSTKGKLQLALWLPKK